MKQIPSLANLSLLEFGDQVKQLVEAGVTMFHVDLMDGHYVPSLCLPPRTIRDIKEKYPDVTVEVHLMADDPLAYIDELKACGADYVSFHADSTHFVRRTLNTIREAGMKAGVVLNPSQRIEVIEPYAGLLDYLIFMSVEPGYAGQRFLPGSMERLMQLSEYRNAHSFDFEIFIDGGVDYEHLPDLIRCGADAVVTGIYIVFQQEDGIAGACRRFEKAVEQIENGERGVAR